jgi:hypothetical protein
VPTDWNPVILRRVFLMLDLKEEKFSEKEKVLLRLKEYDALRAEITAMATGHNQFIALAGAGIGAAATVGVAKVNFKNEPQLGLTEVALLVLLVAAILLVPLVGIWMTWRHVRRLGQHIRGIERTINGLVGTPVLTWERNCSRRRLLACRWMGRAGKVLRLRRRAPKLVRTTAGWGTRIRT